MAGLVFLRREGAGLAAQAGRSGNRMDGRVEARAVTPGQGRAEQVRSGLYGTGQDRTQGLGRGQRNRWFCCVIERGLRKESPTRSGTWWQL